LLALVLGTGAAYLATRESSRPKPKTGPAEAAEVPLVDERPLPTARALAALAITPEEQRLAQEAARIADHEVDLAFADAFAGVEMQIRYITSANERYVTRSKLYEKIVGLLRGEAKPQGQWWCRRHERRHGSGTRR
jgi:hypothetical protein